MGNRRPTSETGLECGVSHDSPRFSCRVDELVEGQARGFDPLQRGKDSVFALVHEGQLRLYRNSCPHLDVRLEYRKDRFLSADGQLIVCYAHGAQFRRAPANVSTALVWARSWRRCHGVWRRAGWCCKCPA